MEALSSSLPFSTDKAKGVKLEVKDDKLTLSKQHPDLGEFTRALPCFGASGEVSIGLNANYLLDALRFIKEERVVIQLEDDVSPMVIESADESLKFVVMPMRLLEKNDRRFLCPIGSTIPRDGSSRNGVARAEPPRFAVGDLVVQIVSNELYQVADRYWAQVDLVDTWIYVCQKMKIDDEAGRILRTTRCDADLEEIPDAELQPLPPQRLPEKPKSLPPAPPRTALPQTLVLRSFLPPKETPALTGPQGALQPPRRLPTAGPPSIEEGRRFMIVKWNLPRYLRQDQVRAFFSVIRNPRDKALFTTIYLYGLRVSEACLLQREDLDFERRTIRVWRVKNGYSGEKPLFRRLVAILRRYLRTRTDDNAALFVGQTGPALEALDTGPLHPLRHRRRSPAESEARALSQAQLRDPPSRRRRADRLRSGPPRSSKHRVEPRLRPRVGSAAKQDDQQARAVPGDRAARVSSIGSFLFIPRSPSLRVVPALQRQQPRGSSASGSLPLLPFLFLRRARPHLDRRMMHATAEIDVLSCPECGGRLRLLATIEDPAVIRKILSHLGIATECPRPAAARPPPETAGFFDFGAG